MGISGNERERFCPDKQAHNRSDVILRNMTNQLSAGCAPSAGRSPKRQAVEFVGQVSATA